LIRAAMILPINWGGFVSTRRADCT
jgi:hypothetical protein